MERVRGSSNGEARIPEVEAVARMVEPEQPASNREHRRIIKKLRKRVTPPPPPNQAQGGGGGGGPYTFKQIIDALAQGPLARGDFSYVLIGADTKGEIYMRAWGGSAIEMMQSATGLLVARKIGLMK